MEICLQICSQLCPAGTGTPCLARILGGSVDMDLLPGLGCRPGIGGVRGMTFLGEWLCSAPGACDAFPCALLVWWCSPGKLEPKSWVWDQCSLPSSPSFVFVLSQIFNPGGTEKLSPSPLWPHQGNPWCPLVPLGLKMRKWEHWEKGRPLMRGETT